MKQAFFTFKYANGAYWDWPGFPSLMVPYGQTSDYYFSGHVGFFVIMLRERFYTEGDPITICMILFFWCFEILVLLAYRQHYSIDLPIGIFHAFWIYNIADAISIPMDRWFGLQLQRLKRAWFKHKASQTQIYRNNQKATSEIESSHLLNHLVKLINRRE